MRLVPESGSGPGSTADPEQALQFGMGVVLLSLAIIGIPLSPFVMDLCLGTALALSLLICLMAISRSDPLEFSVFPSLLILFILFRLALNIASTRLILGHGHEGPEAAGGIIYTFGILIVGGSFVVGGVIFAILVLVNYLVITRGAERVAEVTARFALDALPGRQMSIDSALNSGSISQEEGRRRRERLALETDFYGSMDGASKFIRGDAIMGLVIVAINILGGILIGIFQHGMPIATAAQRYTVLTIGEGIVGQLPALLVSISAGLLVTRSRTGQTLDVDLGRQLRPTPFLAGLLAVILGMMAFLPGAGLSFLILACGAGVYATVRAGRNVREKGPEGASESEQPSVTNAGKRGTGPSVPSLPERLRLEVGLDLVAFMDARHSSGLPGRIHRLCEEVAHEVGIVVPGIQVRDNLQLPHDAYRFCLNGTETTRGSLLVQNLLVLGVPGEIPGVSGRETQDPVYGTRSLWVAREHREKAARAGYAVVDCPSILVAHLSEILKSNMHEFFGRQELEDRLSTLATTHPGLVGEFGPQRVPRGTVLRVFQNLLRERVSVVDLVSILEALADGWEESRDITSLTETVRHRLARQLTRQCAEGGSVIQYIGVHPAVEEALLESRSGVGPGPSFTRRLTMETQMVSQVAELLGEGGMKDSTPVLLCSPGARPYVQRLMAEPFPTLAVLSHREITRDVKLVRRGEIGPGEPLGLARVS